MEKLYLDISKYNKNIDYKEVAKHIDGVILRVGYTAYGSAKSKQKDQMFEKHYQGFREAGVPIGVYWYSCASSVNEAKVEAELTLQYIKDKVIELPVWFDTEDPHHQKPLTKTALTSIVRAFCDTIEKAGYYTGIYASTSWLNGQLNMDSLSDYDVWVAHYNVKKPTYTGKYGMWQYTSGGAVDGIVGRVDMNKVYKDYEEIIKNAKLNNLSKQVESIYYPIPKSWNGVSITLGLTKIGVNSSFSYRRQIAKKNGITLYLGTSKQNIKLCGLLQTGKLIKV